MVTSDHSDNRSKPDFKFHVHVDHIIVISSNKEYCNSKKPLRKGMSFILLMWLHNIVDVNIYPEIRSVCRLYSRLNDHGGWTCTLIHPFRSCILLEKFSCTCYLWSRVLENLEARYNICVGQSLCKDWLKFVIICLPGKFVHGVWHGCTCM